MKLLKLSYAVAVTVTSSLIAINNSHAKIVDVKSRCLGGAQCGIEIKEDYSYPITKEEFKKKLKNLKDTGRTGTRIYSASGKIKENIRISSDHSFEICNGDDNPAYFPVKYKSNDSLGHGADHSINEYVLGNSCSHGSASIFFVNAYEYSGIYGTSAMTEIENVHSTRSTDSSSVYVSTN
jgi:hypothetical protein